MGKYAKDLFWSGCPGRGADHTGQIDDRSFDAGVHENVIGFCHGTGLLEHGERIDARPVQAFDSTNRGFHRYTPFIRLIRVVVLITPPRTWSVKASAASLNKRMFFAS